MEPATLYMMIMRQGDSEEHWFASKLQSLTQCERFVTEIRRTKTNTSIIRYECKINGRDVRPPDWYPHPIVIAK